MAKKIDTKSDMTEISTIRDILMGQQINEYESRFLELINQLKDSENRILAKMEKVQKEFDNRLAILEESIKRNSSELNTKVDRAVDQDRIRLGKILADISNELLKKE